MRHLKSMLVALLVSGLCFVGIGYFLNSTYHIEKSIVIDAPQSEVFKYTKDLHKWPAWTSWNDKKYQNLVINYSGKSAGPGLIMSWTADGDRGKVIHTATKGSNIYFDVVFEDDLVTEGHIFLNSRRNGVQVTWVMDGDVGNNYFKRYMLLFVDKLMIQDMNTGLLNLKKICEKDGYIILQKQRI